MKCVVHDEMDLWACKSGRGVARARESPDAGGAITDFYGQRVGIDENVCIISARGLRRSPSLLKPQWFAVGWINSNDKYCTKIDSTGGSNPTWKTKFTVTVDDENSNVHEMLLTIEVYRRDPIFLREKLQGTATVLLKEHFAKFARERDFTSSGIEETGSFQLRKRNTIHPRGLVDVSVSISEGREDVTSYSGGGEGWYSDSQNEIQLTIEEGPVLAKHGPFGSYPASRPEDYTNRSPSRTGYRQSSSPPPPPPPSNAGFLPTWFPGTSQPHQESYKKMSPKGHPGQNNGMGLGPGALAAGAAIFGEDFMSGSGLPPRHRSVSTDPPF